MDDLLAKAGTAGTGQTESFPFPSLDVLHKACGAFPRTRDMTAGLERLFLDVKDPIKVVLDPVTQPLSWGLRNAIDIMQSLPWWAAILILVTVAHFAGRRTGVTVFVLVSFLGLAFIDHLGYAMQTLAIIMVCTFICVLFGVPIGIAMSRSNRLERWLTPFLDLLQTLPTFVYLIPLIFLFSVTEPKLYGIAIILYA
ncbi:MAG: ABC transporter permease subunit, partial [Mesorhizobium sp.]